MDIGLVTAFLGGTLALLSPCAALLLPAFFASTVGSGPRLWAHGAVFYVGMLVVLVPLGVGAGALGALVATHRDVVVGVSAVLLVVLGLAQALGLGFDPARLVPGAGAARRGAATRTGWTKTFLLGAAGGAAGLCAGPILGAVLTLAAAQGDVVGAAVLLAVYGAGTVVPLLVIAALWGRLGTRGRTVLRGRAFTVAGRELHTTSVATGLLLVVVGVVFWLTNGLVGVPEVLPVETQARLQEAGGLLATPGVDVAAILLLAVVVLVVWTRHRTRRAAARTGTSADGTAADPAAPSTRDVP